MKKLTLEMDNVLGERMRIGLEALDMRSDALDLRIWTQEAQASQAPPVFLYVSIIDRDGFARAANGYISIQQAESLVMLHYSWSLFGPLELCESCQKKLVDRVQKVSEELGVDFDFTA